MNSITKPAKQSAKQKKDEAWNILWHKLEMNGWTIEELARDRVPIVDRFYIPPGVSRTNPTYKNRIDYFDSKLQVKRFCERCESTPHEKTINSKVVASNYNRPKKRTKKNATSSSSSSSSSSSKIKLEVICTLTDEHNIEKEKLKNMLARMNKIDNMAKQRGVQGTPDELEQTIRDVFKTLYNVT